MQRIVIVKCLKVALGCRVHGTWGVVWVSELRVVAHTANFF